MPTIAPGRQLDIFRAIQAELDGGVLTLTLNRPDQGNAMNVAMTLEIAALLDAIEGDPGVRVLVIRGAGADFCAGLDTSDFGDAVQHGEAALRAARSAADDWRSRRLRALPQPVIAMVHGRCHGEAIAIVEGCDVVFAADAADFALPEVDAGAFPAAPVGKAIGRVMTPRAASLHALTGRSFDGREAERNGLVTRSFAAAELEQQTGALAAELVAKDALALRFTKETLQHVGAMSWEGALSFNAAKAAELKALQADGPSARAAGVEKFLAGQIKPGLGG